MTSRARLAVWLLVATGCVDSIEPGSDAPAPSVTCHAHEECADGEACDASSCRVCPPPVSCESEGRSCGPLSDGCRLSLDCGSCGPDEQCDGGGSCVPTDAALCAQEHACGEVVLRERALDCGACAAGRCEQQRCCSCPAGAETVACGLCLEGASPPAPAPRYGVALARLPAEERLLLFGGEDSSLRDGLSAFGDLWSLQPGGAWVEEQPTGTLPSPRAKAGIAILGDSLLLFGGWEGWGSRGGNPCIFDDLFQLRREAGLLVWRRLEPAPGPRPLARLEPAVAATDDGRLFVFGGAFLASVDRSACEQRTDLPARTYGDLWSWDGAAWTELPISGPTPPPRSGASLLHDPVRRRLVLFGGLSAGRLHDDTWEYDLARGAWSPTSPASKPPARAEHAAVWSGGAGIVFGGTLGEGLSGNDAWRWDGSTWTELGWPDGLLPPTKRRCAALAEAAGGSLALFGGLCLQDCADPERQLLDDTWLLPLP